MIKIAGRKIATGLPCFIIAEAGVNHNGSLDTAKQMIDVAVEAGADAVKFQTFKAANLVTAQAPKAEYQQKNTGSSESQYQMLKRLELSAGAHRELLAYCQSQDILFMSTPFDEESADFLAELDIPIFKIPSGEVTNLPFLAYVARKQKPIILSTGMAYLSEVDEAVRVIQQNGCQELVLLHCVSNYPADPAEVNLQAMQTMSHAFQLPVGYSDHTLGNEVALASVAMGASVIEKHFTLDKNLPGPDHRASLEPAALTELVKGIRIVEQALGNGRKQPTPSEINTAIVARKSLVAAQDIGKNTLLSEAMIAIKRPGNGLPPSARPYLIGRRLNEDVSSGTLLSLDMLI